MTDISMIAQWIEELQTEEYETGRGFGHTTTSIIRSRESIAQGIRDGLWRHTKQCLVNRSSDGIRAKCDCPGRSV